MISERNVVRGALVALALAVGAIGYNVTRARADGIPAMNPTVYSGTLEDGGRPVEGTRNMRITIWDDATSMESARIRCITSAPGVSVTGGRFQVPLDNACTPVFRSTPDLWVEVEVNGTSLGRTKIAAVPFAVEAARAADLAPSARNSLVPPGSIVAFGGTEAPAGWLLCDGRAVSRTMFPALFAAIGTSHGSGDGTTSFNLPDMRGRFLRGVDLGAGRDPDRASRTPANTGGNVGDTVGSVQGHQFASHAHNYNVHGASFGDGSGAASLFQGFPVRETRATAAAGGNETRPVNVNVNFIIKM